ncbi:MAG: hypothetical protein HYZ13_11775 [Acidobacteria bacterium]|nr:hypothetical protein [Acidobacteriota bacterium]
MSDLSVAEALEALERELAAGLVPDAQHLAEWRARFDAAASSADRGPGWPSLVERAHALAAQVDRLTLELSQRRDEIRRELEHQATGNRALKGYGSTLA